MTRILVTGGSGFIGSHLASSLLKKGHDVVVLDVKKPEFSGAEYVDGDVSDSIAVGKAAADCETVFHLAALVGVQESFVKPAETVRTNEVGTVNVLDAARKAGVQKIVFASTAAVYGETDGRVSEKTVPAPLSIYASTKLCGEHLCRAFLEKYGLNYAALRFFNVFGPGQKAGAYAAVIPRFMESASKNESLLVYGDGSQTRDFVFIDDVVKACGLAAERGSGVYNIGSGEAVSIRETAEKIIALANSKSRIIFKKGRPGDVVHSCADISRAERGLGFKPAFSFEDGLQKTVEWGDRRA